MKNVTNELCTTEILLKFGETVVRNIDLLASLQVLFDLLAQEKMQQGSLNISYSVI